MDKYTTRCSSLSGKLSLLTSATLIKTEREAERWEPFGRGDGGVCSRRVVRSGATAATLSGTERVPQRGEINLNS